MNNFTEQTGTPITAAGKLFAEQTAAFARISAEREALMAPIKTRLAELHDEHITTRDTYADKIGAALTEISLDDLTDPFRAMEFFEASWNNGYGVPQDRSVYRSLFGDAYILSVVYYYYGERDKHIYMAPQLAVPENADEDKLALTAKLVAAVHRANMEIVGELTTAKMEVRFDDDDGYNSCYVVFSQEFDEWVLEGSYGGAISRSADLLDLLRKLPTYG